MPGAALMYLVRYVGPKYALDEIERIRLRVLGWKSGIMFTVLAHSERGAVKLFTQSHRPPPNSVVAVKLRGGTDSWSEYELR